MCARNRRRCRRLHYYHHHHHEQFLRLSALFSTMDMNIFKCSESKKCWHKIYHLDCFLIAWRRSKVCNFNLTNNSVMSFVCQYFFDAPYVWLHSELLWPRTASFFSFPFFYFCMLLSSWLYLCMARSLLFVVAVC